MKSNLLLVLLIYIPFSLIGQTLKKKDSLSKYTFEELSNKFYAAKPDSLKAVLYAKYAIKKAKKEKDTIQLGNANYNT